MTVAEAKGKPYGKEMAKSSKKLTEAGGKDVWNNRGEDSVRYFQLFLLSSDSFQRKIMDMLVYRIRKGYGCRACVELKPKWGRMLSTNMKNTPGALNTLKCIEVLPPLIEPYPKDLRKQLGKSKQISTILVKICLAGVEGGIC